MSEKEKYQILLAEVGRIISAYSQLEERIGVFIVSLIDDYECITRVIPVELSFRDKVALAKSLYRVRLGEDDDYREMSELFSKATELKGKRDQIAHSSFYDAGCSQKVTLLKKTAKQKTGYKTSARNLSIDDLSNLADSISNHSEVIGQFLLKMTKNGKFLTNKVYPADDT